MNRAGEPSRCMSSVRFIFCYPGWRRKTKRPKHAGWSRSVHVNKNRIARPGNFPPAIFAGLLMGLFVRAWFKRIGKRRWKYVDPVRYLIPCYKDDLLSPGPSPNRRRPFLFAFAKIPRAIDNKSRSQLIFRRPKIIYSGNANRPNWIERKKKFAQSDADR